MNNLLNSCLTRIAQSHVITILILAEVVFCGGCSKVPEANDIEKSALTVLESEYKPENLKKDDQGRVIELKLEGDHVDDLAMEQVRKLEMLQSLSLLRSSVTDTGIEKIQKLKRLMWINIVSTPITDRGLGYLEKMPSLQRIRLLQTDKLTTRGIESLKQTIPGISVVIVNQRAP